jgi:hypothetical protein
MDMPPLFLYLDHYLIWFFRLTNMPLVDFLIGTAVMALLALCLGKFGSAAVLTAGRRYTQHVVGEAKKYQDLSHEALKIGDRSAYEAANKLANEAFNKSFFHGVAQSAAYFWPVGLVLAWMQYRFLNIELLTIPGTGLTIGFVGVFILLYTMIILIINYIKRKISPTSNKMPGI